MLKLHKAHGVWVDFGILIWRKRRNYRCCIFETLLDAFWYPRCLLLFTFSLFFAIYHLVITMKSCLLHTPIFKVDLGGERWQDRIVVSLRAKRLNEDDLQEKHENIPMCRSSSKSERYVNDWLIAIAEMHPKPVYANSIQKVAIIEKRPEWIHAPKPTIKYLRNDKRST
jgi:hypothetical protein